MDLPFLNQTDRELEDDVNLMILIQFDKHDSLKHLS